MEKSIGQDKPAPCAGGKGGLTPPDSAPATPGDSLVPDSSRYRFIGVTVKFDTFVNRFVKRDRASDPPHPKWNRRRELWENQLRFPWHN